MTTEQRTIPVVAYRDPDGKPTCVANWLEGRSCQFMHTRKFGLVEVCGARMQDIERNGGWLRPVDGCPVWAEGKP